jgi:hypothetical protein
MAHGAYDDTGRGGPGGCDPEDFGWRKRAFAAEARRVLGCPDSPFRELMDLHWRGWDLLHEAPEAQAADIDRWVLVIRQAIVARLNGWMTEEFESGAA